MLKSGVSLLSVIEDQQEKMNLIVFFTYMKFVFTKSIEDRGSIEAMIAYVVIETFLVLLGVVWMYFMSKLGTKCRHYQCFYGRKSSYFYLYWYFTHIFVCWLSIAGKLCISSN